MSSILSTSPYTRLPGSGIRRQGLLAVTATRNTLWQGDDHLLSADLTGFTETYKRFYFRDIQAFIVRKTRRGMVWSVVFAVLAALSSQLFLARTRPTMVTAAVLTGLFLWCLLVNWLRGPTCICHLQTAVQTEELPALRRLRAARSFIAAIRRKILAAQGAMPAAAHEAPPASAAAEA